MKKLFFSVFSVALIFGSFLNGPVQVGAASKSAELVEPANVYYKTLTIERTYTTRGSIPSSIYYPKDTSGYSGTLYLQEAVFNGSTWKAKFSGTVTCSVVCAIPY
jgi:hypothetical protein